MDHIALRRSRGALAAAVGFAVLYLAAVLLPLGRALDESVYQALRLPPRHPPYMYARLLGQVLGPGCTVPLGVVLLTALVVTRRGASLPTALRWVVLLAAAWTLKEVLPRPHDLRGNSFPSGHIAALCGVLLIVSSWRPVLLRIVAVILVGAALACLAWVVVGLQWHRPSDILGSVLLAVATGVLGSPSDKTAPGPSTAPEP